MFDDYGPDGDAAEWSMPSDEELDRLPDLGVVPVEAYAGAPLDDEGYPVPKWLLFEGRPVVVQGATRPADAWEQAADLMQARLDEAEAAHRAADLARLDALLIAAETSMQDLRVRYGSGDSALEVHGMRAFAKQTALSLGMSPHRVVHLLDTAATAERTLSATWAVHRRLAAPWRVLELAVAEAEGLPAEAIPAYDEAAAGLVATTPITRLGAALRKKRERLQDDTARARAERTRQRRTVRFHPGRDGAASLTFHGPAAELAAVATALTKAAIAAKTKDEPRTVTQLRFDIGLDLLVGGLRCAADAAQDDVRVPARKGVDVVAAVTVPALAWLGVTKEQATLEGVGPIALETALGLAVEATSLIRVLTDPVTGVRIALDRTTYRPPADLARWVTYRDQRCRFPGCNRVAAECDVDHAVEWQHHGVTNDDNLVTVCRGDHTAKSMRLWQEELLANGRADWESPWGRRFSDPPPEPADPAPRRLLPDECPF